MENHNPAQEDQAALLADKLKDILEGEDDQTACIAIAMLATVFVTRVPCESSISIAMQITGIMNALWNHYIQDHLPADEKMIDWPTSVIEWLEINYDDEHVQKH